jgi:hypothetical protein
MITFKTIFKKMSNFVVVICTSILCNVLLANTVFANETNAQFIVGEVMVKFNETTEPNQLVVKANQSNPANLEILTPVASLLSDKTGIPLTVKQLLSGAWLLLTIDADKLTRWSVKQLQKRNSISDIQLTASESPAIGAIELKNMDVSFQPDSLEYKTIKAKHAGTADDNFAKLIRELSNTLNLPLQGKADQRGHLILQIDVKNMTIDLSNRLQSLTELIASVQLNYIATGMQKNTVDGLQ